MFISFLHPYIEIENLFRTFSFFLVLCIMLCYYRRHTVKLSYWFFLISNCKRIFVNVPETKSITYASNCSTSLIGDKIAIFFTETCKNVLYAEMRRCSRNLLYFTWNIGWKRWIPFSIQWKKGENLVPVLHYTSVVVVWCYCWTSYGYIEFKTSLFHVSYQVDSPFLIDAT